MMAHGNMWCFRSELWATRQLSSLTTAFLIEMPSFLHAIVSANSSGTSAAQATALSPAHRRSNDALLERRQRHACWHYESMQEREGKIQTTPITSGGMKALRLPPFLKTLDIPTQF